MTTHFRRRVSGALPQHTTGHNRQNSAPPLPNSFTNKDLREKALRERGLLPALPRDLSAQEAARDQQKTHVKSLSDDEAGRGKKTAAMLIREEYEAKERQLANQESSDSSRGPYHG
ncbi:hypothetical protein NEOLEDRAFT_1127503 [Neolentinus lepideus HHB14362 ss-1]|uniref:Uncharacterized protein n=1 Tax=Neolentinus lepideus HHB14362 ss-1 TaxID=1314782 RepID=A0A165VIH8_9AGAM|nr:hypothetical protein NEOLEDRAFT_1127503 [Neolentinus lepideus HHB14362 ss-1]